VSKTVIVYARSVHNQIPGLGGDRLMRYSLRPILDVETHTDGGRGPTIPHGPQLEYRVETPDACTQQDDRLFWNGHKLDWWQVFEMAKKGEDGFSLPDETA
jgi:hypothetical protein